MGRGQSEADRCKKQKTEQKTEQGAGPDAVMAKRSSTAASQESSFVAFTYTGTTYLPSTM